MVLESIITPFKAKEKPWHLFYLGFFFSIIALFLSLWIFEEHSSLIMVFLTVFAVLPFVVKAIKKEESIISDHSDEKSLLKSHFKALSGFLLLFLGMVLGYVILYTLLPKSIIQNVFSVQIETITNINSTTTGFFFVDSILGKILYNNLRVLALCILFSFIYGAGAIFILTWNASVIGTAIGNFIRDLISTSGINYFSAFSLGMLRYLIHGIPEIFAYFVGGLAGGIISYAIINHDFRTKKFENILMDSSDLVISSIIILIGAAFIEVYLTPILF